MNRADVLRWTDGLRDALRGHVKLSRAAAREDGRMLSMVVNGLRCAGMFAVVPTSKETIRCLVQLLHSMNVHQDDVFILVHTTSEQTFVVHRHRLLERLQRSPHVAYCAINASSEHDGPALNVSAPAYLQQMLDAIHCAVRLAYATPECAEGGALLLSTPHEALTGVGLAGWLLEYTLVYFYEVRSTIASEVNWYSAHSLWNVDDGRQQDSTPLKNRLAHLPLYVLCVELWTGADEHDIVLQFSIPKNLVPTLVDSLKLRGVGIAAVVDSLRECFQARSPNAMRVEVHWHERTMDRVVL